MSHLQISIFFIILILLILLSGFFSAAETALMTINRYRLRHKARMKKSDAVLILKMLKRPDRLLGTLLIGNNFTNILASALATLLAVYFFGEKGVIVSTILLTFIILIFAEVTPKTVAALYSDRVSKLVAWPVYWVAKLFYPFVWFLNGFSNGLLRLFGVKLTSTPLEPLSREELRSIVYETSSRFSQSYQNMLLNILDLNKLTVEDVLIPVHRIVGVDLEAKWPVILNRIAQTEHDWMPVYKESINQVVGVLHSREFMRESMNKEDLSKDDLIKILHEPYFIPEGTPLNIQLVNFQKKSKRLAFVVDEYGEMIGMTTLVDILEEIVGEFTTTVTTSRKVIEVQSDGSFLVDGSIGIRELNRVSQWRLPAQGPRTLNGLIIEQLEMIPRSGVCLLIAGHPIEIVDVKEKRVKVARVFPRLSDN